MNDIEKAIEYFYKVMEQGNIKNDEQQEIFETAISALEKQLNCGWTPCSERLPQEDEPDDAVCILVNVMLNNGYVSSGWCNRYLKKWFVLDYVRDYPVKKEYCEVIAWQPLPLKYEEVSE